MRYKQAKKLHSYDKVILKRAKKAYTILNKTEIPERKVLLFEITEDFTKTFVVSYTEIS